MDVGVLSVIMVFSIPICAILGAFTIAALKILTGSKSAKKAETSTEETKLIQQIHQGLARMETRVEHLETILIDQARREKE